MVLIGNKSDLSDAERVVSAEEGRQLAARFDIPFHETSAKANVNVEPAFLELATLVRNRLTAISNAQASAADALLVEAGNPRDQFFVRRL